MTTPKRRRKERKLRPKFDARLDALLDIGEARITEIRRREIGALHELAERVHEAGRRERDPEKRRALAREALLGARSAMFAPFTAGIRLPDERRGLPAELAQSTETLLSVFLQTSLANEDLASRGFRVQSRSGERCTALVPWRVLAQSGKAATARDKDIRSIELARALLPSLERADKFTHLAAMHTTGGHQGTGVLIAIADRFLDFHHPDFAADTNGYTAGTPSATRILRLWDQELVADKLQGESTPATLSSLTATLDYGVEYDQTAIQATIDNAADAFAPVRHAPPLAPSGFARHGTQVAGCALGNGALGVSLALPEPREGAAPLSELLFVHLLEETALTRLAASDADFPSLGIVDSVSLIDACSFLMARAQELGRPCVLCLSQNDALGPHDGTSVLEQHLDSLMDRPGRALVVSAGNENAEPTHATGPALAAGASVQIDVLTPANAVQPVEIQIWYSAGDSFDASVTLVTAATLGHPSTTTLLVASSPANAEAAYLPTGDPLARVLSTVPAPNGDNVITILLLPDTNTGLVPEGMFSIVLTATKLGASAHAGEYQAWMSSANGQFANPINNQQTIASPATASRAIAVGAHDLLSGATPVLDVASGRGPQRNGPPRPDLCAPTGVLSPAPGARVAAADVPPASYDLFVGTSAAAPLVAGAAAIVLECSAGAADWLDVKNALCTAAATGGQVLDSNYWGAGWLDAATICQTTQTRVERRLPDLRWELVPEDMLPIFEIVPHVPNPPDPPWVRQHAFQLKWQEPQAGFALQVSSASGIDHLQIELPFKALDARFPAAMNGAHLPTGLLGPEETHAWLNVEGARASRVVDGRVLIWADKGAWLVVPSLRVSGKSALKLVVRVQRRAGVEEVPALRLEQFQRGGRLRVFHLQGSPGP